MAFRPSLRRTHSEESTEPNLTPIMNLMVVLIPLLLTSAQFIKLGIIELNLPPSVQGGDMVAMPKENELKLDLSVSITQNGFTISSAMAVLRNEAGEAVSVAKKEDGSYDFEKLNEQLIEVKTRVENKFTDTNKIIIMAEPDIDYQTLVSAMDAARAPFKTDTVLVNGTERILTPQDELFPEVSISAGIVL